MRLPRIDGPGPGRLRPPHRSADRGPARRRLRPSSLGAVARAGPCIAVTATASRAFARSLHSRPGAETTTRLSTKADHHRPASAPVACQAMSSPSRSGTPAEQWWPAWAVASPVVGQTAEEGRVLAIPYSCRLTAPRQKGGTAPGGCKGGSVPRSLRSLLYSPSLRADLCIPP